MTLTVTDLARSTDFYNRVFSAQTAMAAEDEDGAFILCMGESFMVGLRKHGHTPDGDSFHFARVGMDHMGVHVETGPSSRNGLPTSTSTASATPASSKALTVCT